MSLRRTLVVLLGIGVCAALPSGAQQTLSISGTVAAENGAPIQRALVTLDPTENPVAVRTSPQGQFRFDSVKAGPHELHVNAIGYFALTRLLVVADSDLVITIVLVRPQRALDTVTVRVNPIGVFGSVSNLESLAPISGAKVQIIGSRLTDTTDTAGLYHLEKVKPGNYVARFTKPGFDARVVPLPMTRDSVRELSVFLAPSTASSGAKRDALWRDADSRISQGGNAAVLVPANELGPNPRASLAAALARARSLVTKNPVGQGRCIFLEGRPLTSLPLWAFDVGEVSAVEVYGGKSAQAHSLLGLWPNDRTICAAAGAFGEGYTCGIFCGGSNNRLPNQGRPRAKPEPMVVVIWLKR